MSLSPEWLMSIGILFVLSELVLGLFVPIFFGIGMIILASVQFFTGMELSLAAQGLISFTIGAGTMLALRKRFFRSREQDEDQMPQSTFQGGTHGTLIKNETTGLYQVKANGTYWRLAQSNSYDESVLESMINKPVLVVEIANNEAVIEVPSAPEAHGADS